jgi:hypothetical protein
MSYTLNHPKIFMIFIRLYPYLAQKVIFFINLNLKPNNTYLTNLFQLNSIKDNFI